MGSFFAHADSHVVVLLLLDDDDAAATMNIRKLKRRRRSLQQLLTEFDILMLLYCKDIFCCLNSTISNGFASRFATIPPTYVSRKMRWQKFSKTI